MSSRMTLNLELIFFIGQTIRRRNVDKAPSDRTHRIIWKQIARSFHVEMFKDPPRPLLCRGASLGDHTLDHIVGMQWKNIVEDSRAVYIS